MSKTILITGSTDGIGKATAELLAEAGHKIIVHARSDEKGERIAHEIQQKTGNTKVKFVTADFRKLSEVAEMCSELLLKFSKIDVLINNAGVFRQKKNILQNKLEETVMVNHLSPFFLTLKLIPLLKNSKQGRIINVSSMIHASEIDFNKLQGENFYDGGETYSASKLCNLLFTNKLADDLKLSNITVNALHPGVVQTKLLRAGWGAMGEEPENSAKRFAFLAESEQLKEVTGRYFMNNKQTNPAPIANQKYIMDKLWEISTELISQQGF
ncbi:MAG: SDR family NAD(P)-dependent oxidoreductase [Draconibacterium sp.]|nr:SDR family NAD(P)-dependent oxidoreductase [Draconibacterium sp.]